MHAVKQSILKVIAYFDVFDYPVTAGEIVYFLDKPCTEASVAFALRQLEDYNMVYRFNNLYTLRNNYSLVERRINGNMLAEKRLKQAKAIAGFLMWFPFIRGVAISGSLSKNFAYDGSDIDFFIITATNRLWIARMLFLCFFWPAKLMGFKNYFCLNYFIDETALQIPEQNIYTAIEIATLMPCQGREVFEKFFEENSWIKSYLPNCTEKCKDAASHRRPLPKRVIEWPINNKAGLAVNNALANFYKKRWQKMMLQKKYGANGFLFGSYIAAPDVCKPIPHFFQEKILNRFEQRMEVIEKIWYPAELVAV